MKATLSLFIVSYYLFGILCLPRCDFSVLTDLPEMYRQCKSTEDKDMGPLDFITDHLLNIDGVFDKHDKGDEQKPHNPLQFRHTLTQTVFFPAQIIASLLIPLKFISQHSILEEIFSLSAYCSPLFRPPIA